MSIANIKELFERGLIWGAENNSEYDGLRCGENNSQITSILEAAEAGGNRYSVNNPELSSDNYGSIGVAEIDSSLPGGGWKKGATHEFFYSINKFTSPPVTLPSILASQSSKQIFWVGKQAWPAPFLLERLSFPKMETRKNYQNCCFFLDPKERKEALWSIETILRGSSNCSLIADCSLLNFSLSRRLTLAAESSNSLLILLREQKYARSPGSATTRWNITQALSSNDLPSWQLELLQCRGKEPSQKIWKIEERLTEEKVTGGQYGETISLHLSAEMEGVLKGNTTRQQQSGTTRAA